MPIRPDLRPFYRGPAWRATRERIRERAKDRCEQCGKPNGETVETHTGRTIPLLQKPGLPAMCWRSAGSGWRTQEGSEFKPPFGDPRNLIAVNFGRVRSVRVVLAVCHANGVSGDDRDENLFAWCQWCHLNHDRDFHRETRSLRKDSTRPIAWEGAIAI
jgi:hypothetical protein